MTTNLKKILLAFGNSVSELNIPEKNLSSIILPSEPEEKDYEALLIKKALENPVKSRRLSEIVNPDSKISIIVSDVTRPTPTAKILPPLLEELYLGGGQKTRILPLYLLSGCTASRLKKSAESFWGGMMFPEISGLCSTTGIGVFILERLVLAHLSRFSKMF